MKLNACFWSRTAKEERNCQKKEDRPLDLIQHFFQVSMETESAKTGSSNTNFYSVYLLFISEYLELIHCLNELCTLLLCKTTREKKRQKLNTYHLCSLLVVSHFFQSLRQLSLQDTETKKKKRKLILGCNFGSLIRLSSPPPLSPKKFTKGTMIFMAWRRNYKCLFLFCPASIPCHETILSQRAWTLHTQNRKNKFIAENATRWGSPNFSLMGQTEPCLHCVSLEAAARVV